jgi:hypothetical protein
MIIVAASLFLGISWNQNAIQRVLHDGYDSTARITSAQETGLRFPFVLEGWWPRFVDEALSINLKWTGRDGAERSRSGIAVSNAYAARIMDGNAVKLIEVPVRVIDDKSSLPVIIEDASDRLRHIQFLKKFALIALAALGVALAGLIAWQKFSSPRERSLEVKAQMKSKRQFQYKLALSIIIMIPYRFNPQRCFRLPSPRIVFAEEVPL